MAELVTDDPTAFESLARRLATEPDRLAAIKARVCRAREQSALYDTARYARNFEALIERMVARWRAGEAPARLEPEQA
ncbi:MAG: hypothetical protein JSW68_05850 [Burkholderiales bacterium]|nr:MAG: hypothetical protein JSW68_05850 [Burkholderiales bacterium]